MISLLQGTVHSIESDGVIVDVGGVGFHVHIPAPFKDRMQAGEAAYFFTRLIVREDLLALYGFESKESRGIFDLLLGVSGVGPRLALAVLSSLSLDAIRRAVFNEQVEVFSRVPGVGRKTAQKILLHLQDRLPKGDALEAIAAMSDVDSEVLAALTTLGYSVVEAQAALQYIPRDAPQNVEERLRLALQYFTAP